MLFFSGDDSEMLKLAAESSDGASMFMSTRWVSCKLPDTSADATMAPRDEARGAVAAVVSVSTGCAAMIGAEYSAKRVGDSSSSRTGFLFSTREIVSVQNSRKAR